MHDDEQECCDELPVSASQTKNLIDHITMPKDQQRKQHLQKLSAAAATEEQKKKAPDMQQSSKRITKTKPPVIKVSKVDKQPKI